MRKILLFNFLSVFFLQLNAQTTSVTLSGTQYLENFDNIGSGLPVGWGTKTGVTSNTVLGTDAALTTANTTLWNSTSGRFNNYASGNIGANGDQAAATDRALGVRQTGSVGDPGAAFVVKIANTTGFSDFQLSFKLQSLDATSVRSVNWVLEYATGETPTSFTALTTTPATLTTGGSTFGNTTINTNLGAALNNISSPVWIRLRTAAASTGGGNRPSTAIDDFILTFSGASASPTINVSVDSLKNFRTSLNTPSAPLSYIVSGSKLTNDVLIKAPFDAEVSLTNTSGFVDSLILPQTGGNVSSKTIFARLKGGTQGNFTGTVTHTSAGAPTKNVILTGTINPAAVASTVVDAKKLADGRTVIFSGRLTVKGEFGGRLVYVQDATGGMSVFSSNLAVYPTTWQIGDSVQVTGDMGTFNGKRQVLDPTSVKIIDGQMNKPVVPKTILPDKLSENEGLLVTLDNMNFTTSGNFVANTNYQAANCASNFATIRINNSANPFATKPIPSVTQNITGIVEVFNGNFQLMPRLATDMIAAAQNCPLLTTCDPQAVLIPQITTPRNQSLDVVTWNVEWFGNTKSGNGPANDTLQQANALCVMSKFSADLVALVEICDTAALGKSLPAGYKYKCSTQYYSHFYDIPETAADLAQKVCVAYNAATVTPIDTACRAILTDKAVYTVGSATNNFWASGRLPYMFTANTLVNGTSRRVRMFVIHAKAGSDTTDYKRRLDDVKALKTELDTKYPTENLIIAGDFNDDLDTSITIGRASTYSDFVKDTARYRSVTKILSDDKRRSTGSFSDMIDHIIVSNELSSAYISNSVGVGSTTSLNFIGAYTSTTSDHFPVWASFNPTRISTSTRELPTGQGIKKVYPNPTSGVLTIEFALDTEGVLEVRNLLGMTLFSQKLKNTEGVRTQTIDIEAVASGLYLISISTSKGISTRLISKM